MPSIDEKTSVTPSTGSDSESVNSETASSLSSTSPSSPFGLPLDFENLNGTVLTSPHTLVASVVYFLSENVFSYAAPGADAALDAPLQLWRTFQRKNYQGVVPELNRFQVRSGASNALLGYVSQSETIPVSVFAAGSALNYMLPTLSKAGSKLPLALNVAALDYDTTTSTLVPDYLTPISTARSLGWQVITPFDANEAQYTSILALALSRVQTTVNLYDGPNFLRESGLTKNVITKDQSARIFKALLEQVPTWKTLPASKRVHAALKALNEVSGVSPIKSFEYSGHATPQTVFVTYGSVESKILLNTVAKLGAANVSVGAVAVRVPLPFDSESFAAAIPATAQRIVVINQVSGSSSFLKQDVASALYLERGPQIRVEGYQYAPSHVWSQSSMQSIISSFVVVPEASSTSPSSGNFLFWSKDNAKLVDLPSKLAHSLSLDPSNHVRYRAKYDNVAAAGMFQAQITTSDFHAGEIDAADVVVVESAEVLDSFNVLSSAKSGATVLLVSSKKIEDIESYAESLPAAFRRASVKRNVKLVAVDLESVGEEEATQGRTAAIALQTAFFKAAYPAADKGYIVNKVLASAGAEAELLAVVIATLVSKVEEVGIKQLSTKKEWADAVSEEETVLPNRLLETSFEANPRYEPSHDAPALESSNEAKKRVVFKESFNTQSQLRPDLPVRNFVVKVQENKRLTPAEYSRNIFHIEFDITGTGLTYDIGEALGIHGRNNTKDVGEFLASYGLNGTDLIQVPHRENADMLETRTVFQAFTENLDILGKPPKRFYEGLAEYATDSGERAKLEHIASAAGASILKEYQEEEFYTYADILDLFPSARPSAGGLAQLIAPLKRREYSIASSQKMHPNAVHLLVVVVDWIDKRGRVRSGHCSKYLSGLSVGTELVVSVKPSVMKLPPLSTQPIVMAGLGTGLAPFKAFVEEKLWQKSQGLEIGEIYLYLGARHKKEEYLYGELWEAYLHAGVMTRVGAAFSRDQEFKIYIQDKIREDLTELTEAISDKNGSFYLCGPTWPVPDITACLQDIITNDAAKRGVTVDSAHEVEEMKETGRYVLEVY
ncbi:unnamed protein product [Kuraishia capsulata CBS 1993]|uniref:assimilatory sulfite reductase (NADPH) n=1 Tax=Kuraishia capsulata CBS 1993 TaxID=1382522 RepID=W6MN01_9ASCO|nr:uncharacterized protein KUCA_T00003956001 [Kuraishia capsulata CBS 1993]CDK27976.1 unnamed protein product [Kuraishia capsulata CBS 1993]